jgi:RNA polymerase sigma factor (sigma-70 family)
VTDATRLTTAAPAGVLESMGVAARGSGAGLSEIEAVYRTRGPAFVRLARAVVSSDEEAWDAVHDAMASAIRSRGDFRGEGTLEAWLWRAVLNAARTRARRGGPLPEEPGTNGHRADPVEREAVRRAVARLPERQRHVLFLRYYAGLDYEEIAAALEIKSGTVGPTLASAQTTLRNLLGGLDP